MNGFQNVPDSVIAQFKHSIYGLGCSDETISLHRHTKQNGTKAVYIQCSSCGHGLQVKNAFVDKWEELPQYRHALSLERYAVYADTKRAQEKKEKDEYDREWWKWYNEYLETPRWRSLRARVLARANHTCEGCLIESANEVHHITYDNVGEEFAWELFAVCHACHKRFHDKKKKEQKERERNAWKL
jgi:5-methylcytosine-specific restriction endonuclease McrA